MEMNRRKRVMPVRLLYLELPKGAGAVEAKRLLEHLRGEQRAKQVQKARRANRLEELKRRRAERGVDPSPIQMQISPGQTIELPCKFRPYAKRGSQIDNLCGQFTTFVSDAPTQLGGLMHRVCSGFGWQNDVYHLDGNLSLCMGRASFKACRSMEGLTRLGGVLGLPDTSNRVHMVVVSSMLGRRMHVPKGGFLDKTLCNSGWPISVGFPLDSTNSVRVSIVHFQKEFAWPDRATLPASNDWTVTGKGALVGRLTWEGIQWTSGVEAEVLAFADRVARLLAGCA